MLIAAVGVTAIFLGRKVSLIWGLGFMAEDSLSENIEFSHVLSNICALSHTLVVLSRCKFDHGRVELPCFDSELLVGFLLYLSSLLLSKPT